ncbi:DUF3099 domain-containing protein [Nocardioides yefusunii]|uniref:DUF3099 domain-containing protein n=1 Tax=Nocardioides yefusunii TaxID=2500546 RepID=A0ABW1QU36_9ACTN|nr:DUF3099 domain-containing protein [Nocardioides yefusunii]
MAGKHDDVVRITTAAPDPEADLSSRQRRYVISMSIRLVCFLGAAAFAPQWPMWVLLAGAVFLPYVAVVGANSKDMRRDEFELDGVSPQFQLGGSGERPVIHATTDLGDANEATNRTQD